MVIGLWFALTLLILVTAVPVIAAGPMTGHHWVDLSETKDGRDMLLLLVRGYIEGYSGGYTLGQTTGAIKAINDLGVLSGEQKKEAYVEAIRSAFEKRPKPQVADVSHYVNELTSFYQAFPLCKGKALFDTLSALAPI
jgi:hypothetical protein